MDEAGAPLNTALDALTRQMLTWIDAQPRTYGECMEAWRTSCPRLSIWEDAMTAGLIEVDPNGALNGARVRLTAKGREAIETQLR